MIITILIYNNNNGSGDNNINIERCVIKIGPLRGIMLHGCEYMNQCLSDEMYLIL